MSLARVSTAALLLCWTSNFFAAWSRADPPLSPDIEFQSGPLTPPLALAEAPRPVHQVRILVATDAQHALLILDMNTPEFDEFGRLTGGIVTPQVYGAPGPQAPVELPCRIDFVKVDTEQWRLYRLAGPSLRTPLRLAIRGGLGEGGPARFLVLNADQRVAAVVDCTRYGLVVP